MTTEPHKRRTLGRPQAEAELARLNRRFRSVSRRHERALLLRRLYRTLRWWALIALCIAGLAWGLTIYTGWPLPITLKHGAAFISRNAARHVGSRRHPKDSPAIGRTTTRMAMA